MRSSKSIFLPKQRMKFCRSVTVQDASPGSESIYHKHDRTFSTININNDKW